MAKKSKNPIPKTANKKELTAQQKKEKADLELTIQRCEESGQEDRVKRCKELLKNFE